jgi:hypothetical protein
MDTIQQSILCALCILLFLELTALKRRLFVANDYSKHLEGVDDMRIDAMTKLTERHNQRGYALCRAENINAQMHADAKKLNTENTKLRIKKNRLVALLHDREVTIKELKKN